MTAQDSQYQSPVWPYFALETLNLLVKLYNFTSFLEFALTVFSPDWANIWQVYKQPVIRIKLC